MNGSVQATEGLALFIHDTAAQTVPAAVLDKAEMAIVDAFAAVLCGAASEVAPPLLNYLAQAGTGGAYRILGTSVRASAELAALANGAFGAALEYDDVFSAMPGHPAAIMVPVLAGEAQREQVSGARFVDAFAIGYEVGAKVALAIGHGHYGRGFHATGTLAMYSALGALARLRRLPVATIRTAFGIASSMAAGLQCNFGTMMKPFHSGWAARCALAAVDLAQCGYTASLTSLEEADGGLLHAYGTAESDPARSLATLAAPWSLLDPGYALKKFPSCYAGHRAMDALLVLREELGLTAQNCAQVICRVPPGSLRPMRYANPRTGLEAKFSIPYALAAGVLDGKYSLWSFSDQAVRRPEIAALMPRMVQVEDEACLDGERAELKKSAGSRGVVEVEVRTTDGRSEKRRVRRAPGHPERALSWEEVEAKFQDCADSAGLPAGAAAEICRSLRAIRGCADLAPVLAAMCPEKVSG